jgi:hypothetical protein
VVLSMDDKVVLGNGERFQDRRVGGERWEGKGPDCSSEFNSPSTFLGS